MRKSLALISFQYTHSPWMISFIPMASVSPDDSQSCISTLSFLLIFRLIYLMPTSYPHLNDHNHLKFNFFKLKLHLPSKLLLSPVFSIPVNSTTIYPVAQARNHPHTKLVPRPCCSPHLSRSWILSHCHNPNSVHNQLSIGLQQQPPDWLPYFQSIFHTTAKVIFPNSKSDHGETQWLSVALKIESFTWLRRTFMICLSYKLLFYHSLFLIILLPSNLNDLHFPSNTKFSHVSSIFPLSFPG